jgi:hypothetical protein
LIGSVVSMAHFPLGGQSRPFDQKAVVGKQ